MKVTEYIIKDLIQIEKLGEKEHGQFKREPWFWKMDYVENDKLRIFFNANYSVNVAINNEISNHDKILNTIIKTFNETIKS